MPTPNENDNGSGAPVVVFVNNSLETFTPTHSGAIASCLAAVGACAQADGLSTLVLSRTHPAASYPDPPVTYVEATARRVPVPLARARRRVTGWSHLDQARYSRSVVDHLRELRPDLVVLSNDPEIAVVVRRAVPETRVVHWFHNLLVPTDRFRRAYAGDPGIRSVAVSRYLARSVEQVFGFGTGRVTAALNGVDTDRFSPRIDPESEELPPTIGFVGRVAVEKGADLLLEAALLLRDRGLAFRVQIAGDTNWGRSEPGPYRDRVLALAEQLASTGVAVIMTGHLDRSRVPDALRATDIHVVPSIWDEPCGLTTLEGLATGLPIVASASGGTPELLAGCGLLFAREDAADLAGQLERLLRDPDLRSELSVRSRARAAELTWTSTWRALAGAPDVHGSERAGRVRA